MTEQDDLAGGMTLENDDGIEQHDRTMYAKDRMERLRKRTTPEISELE
jgi:hypothetical protein